MVVTVFVTMTACGDSEQYCRDTTGGSYKLKGYEPPLASSQCVVAPNAEDGTNAALEAAAINTDQCDRAVKCPRPLYCNKPTGLCEAMTCSDDDDCDSLGYSCDKRIGYCR
jgi:hypothetical protein